MCLLGVATPSWAHGQLRPESVAAASTVDLVLEVPSEREGHISTRIALSLPGGLDPQNCRPPLGWTCAVTARAITWERFTGRAEDFGFTVRVGSRPGTYLLPLVQTYEDGETSDFSGPPDRSDEAPRLVVTGAAPRASSAPRTTAPSNEGPASRPGAVAPTVRASSASSPAASSPEAVATSVRRSPSAVSSATATRSPSPPDRPPAAGEASSGRGPGVTVLAALGVVALAALASGWFVRRRLGR